MLFPVSGLAGTRTCAMFASRKTRRLTRGKLKPIIPPTIQAATFKGKKSHF